MTRGIALVLLASLLAPVTRGEAQRRTKHRPSAATRKPAKPAKPAKAAANDSARGVDASTIARAVVARMALTKGERVLLVAAPGIDDSLITPFHQRITAAGGEWLGAIATTGSGPSEWETDFTRGASELADSALTDYLAKVDVAVMLPAAGASAPIYGAMQSVLKRGKAAGRTRTIHFHWSGAYSLEGDTLPITDAIARTYARALLRTDYAALARKQLAFAKAARLAVIRVTTPEGTDLRFSIGDRPVTRQDGDASGARARQARNLIDREVELPAGAVRVAPIEESVNGKIAFPTSTWNGERVEGLVMTFERGRVVAFDAKTGTAGVQHELRQGNGAARYFRELVVGLNPLLKIVHDEQTWIPYYGYGAGVVRLSLGDNSELGGLVRGSYLRWNLFPDATVTIGKETWVKDGTLVK